MAAWNQVLAASDEETKKDEWKITEKKREPLKDVYVGEKRKKWERGNPTGRSRAKYQVIVTIGKRNVDKRQEVIEKGLPNENYRGSGLMQRREKLVGKNNVWISRIWLFGMKKNIYANKTGSEVECRMIKTEKSISVSCTMAIKEE